MNFHQVYYALQTVTATHQTTAALEILATCAHPLFARHNYPGGLLLALTLCLQRFNFSCLAGAQHLAQVKIVCGLLRHCAVTIFHQQSLNSPSTAAFSWLCLGLTRTILKRRTPLSSFTLPCCSGEWSSLCAWLLWAEQEMVSSSPCLYFVSRVPLVDESSSTTQIADDNDAAAKVTSSVQLDCCDSPFICGNCGNDALPRLIGSISASTTRATSLHRQSKHNFNRSDCLSCLTPLPSARHVDVWRLGGCCVGTADCMLGERGQTRGRRKQPPPLVRTRSWCFTVVSVVCLKNNTRSETANFFCPLIAPSSKKGCSRHSGALFANVLRSNVSRVAPLVHQQTTPAFSHQVSLCSSVKVQFLSVLACCE